MGLDMYLSAKVSMGKYSNEKIKPREDKIRKIFPEMFKTGNLDSLELEFEAGYWRKANQIHKWFVDNCQDGEDECHDSYVSRKDLEKLKELCEKVLKFKNAKTKKKQIKTGWNKEGDTFEEVDVITDTEELEELLPTQSGFFFGGTEYDEYYFNDLENTIKIINKCLKLPEYWGFEYCSSW